MLDHVEDMRLNYDPEFPQQRFRAAGMEAAIKSSTGRLPSTVPWPEASKPTAAPLNTAPAATDDLSKFAGYDAIVVTWTSAEAAALAAMFVPDYLPSRWYEYRHGIANYIPLVTGSDAPFNDKSAEMARYYQSLGLYFPCTIGKAKVLLFKSGLHLDYDGPHAPVRKLMAELAAAVKPKLFITTGTGGGIGKDVALGDVIVAAKVQFDCTTQFKSETFAKAVYQTAALPAGAIAAITPDLTRINAARVVGGNKTPKIWSGGQNTIVTTDFFGFDDSTDHFKLQGLGQACDMGDAMVANALQQSRDIRFYAIRNASDPQIPNPSGNMDAAKKTAGDIYSKYGVFTTAASAIATWAVIDAAINGNKGQAKKPAAKAKPAKTKPAKTKAGKTKPAKAKPAKTKPAKHK
jgi:nucleoside phosphorylase